MPKGQDNRAVVTRNWSLTEAIRPGWSNPLKAPSSPTSLSTLQTIPSNSLQLCSLKQKLTTGRVFATITSKPVRPTACQQTKLTTFLFKGRHESKKQYNVLAPSPFLFLIEPPPHSYRMATVGFVSGAQHRLCKLSGHYGQQVM